LKYLITSIRPKDADEWLRFRNLLWEANDHANEIEQFFAGDLDEPVEVLIARDANGRAVGHVELSIRKDVSGLDGVKTGYIEGLYVDVPYRSSSLVIELLRASENWARTQGCVAFASDRQDRIIIHRRFSDNA
jgi:aminoglycoside 6'-N-acetyltransferase I